MGEAVEVAMAPDSYHVPALPRTGHTLEKAHVIHDGNFHLVIAVQVVKGNFRVLRDLYSLVVLTALWMSVKSLNADLHWKVSGGQFGADVCFAALAESWIVAIRLAKAEQSFDWKSQQYWAKQLLHTIGMACGTSCFSVG